MIEEGLQPGELVIVKGLQRARPGGKVDPEKIDMKTLTASAIKAAAEAKQVSAKTAAAAPAPAGNDSTSAGKEEKPNPDKPELKIED